MTTTAYGKVVELVIDKLKKIKKADGYFNDVTVLNGWLTFYAKDLAKGANGLSFPAVSVHYSTDKFKVNLGSIDVTINRSIKITGAVTTDDPSTINQKLDELIFDVGKAIGTDRKLTIVGAEYMLPEGNDPYAMFDMTIALDINDKWE